MRDGEGNEWIEEWRHESGKSVKRWNNEKRREQINGEKRWEEKERNGK